MKKIGLLFLSVVFVGCASNRPQVETTTRGIASTSALDSNQYIVCNNEGLNPTDNSEIKIDSDLFNQTEKAQKGFRHALKTHDLSGLNGVTLLDRKSNDFLVFMPPHHNTQGIDEYGFRTQIISLKKGSGKKFKNYFWCTVVIPSEDAKLAQPRVVVRDRRYVFGENGSECLKSMSGQCDRFGGRVQGGADLSFIEFNSPREFEIIYPEGKMLFVASDRQPQAGAPATSRGFAHLKHKPNCLLDERSLERTKDIEFFGVDLKSLQWWALRSENEVEPDCK